MKKVTKDTLKNQIEYILLEIGSILNSACNGDYCKHCYKKTFCQVVSPCQAYTSIREELHKLADTYEEGTEEVIQDLLKRALYLEDKLAKYENKE